MTDVNVFFSIEGLVHINIKTDDPREVDTLAWKKFGKVIAGMPEGVAIGEAKVKMITTPDDETVKEESTKVVPDVPIGTYL